MVDLRFAGEGSTPDQVNVAYGLYPPWRGRDLATRAALPASRHAAAEAAEAAEGAEGAEEAVTQVDPENPASAAVARRAGFTPAISHTATPSHASTGSSGTCATTSLDAPLSECRWTGSRCPFA
ncbi:GNAT family N-acetyltransferase [Streptomyces hydrogenans]|uniref:GNAT family N-acetyltransferase n=1 Tax=Streptomyces hydrogenans TaxID=1873719 RepID=UPI0036B54C06